MQQKSAPWFALFGVLVLALIAAPAAAHSPSDLVISYDQGAGQLTATFTHQVPNPSTHYVGVVRILVNEASVVTQQYTSQPTNATFTYTYPLQAAVGSTISVRGECNLEGAITRTLVVNATPTPATTAATATPTATATGTTTTVITTPTTAATTQPTAAPTTAQAPGFALWAGVLGLAAAGCVLALRR
jgi:hypothetical protein